MKFNVSKQTQKKSYFPGVVPCSTTLNFFQPTLLFAHEMIPGTTFHAKMRQYCRTSVLNLPTWGDYKILTKSVFVPFGDVYKPWDSFRSKTRYYGTTSFIPTQVPGFNVRSLLNALVNTVGYGSSQPLCMISVYSKDTGELLPYSSLNEATNFALGVTQKWNINNNWATASSDTLLDGSDSRRRLTKDFFLGQIDSGDFPAAVPTDVINKFRTGQVYVSFSEQAKVIYRILVALGYELRTSDHYSSALPLMCYCKAVYDLFSPNRTDSTQDPFESTPLYGLIYACMGQDNYSISYNSGQIQSLYQMILNNTYYVNNDFYSLFRKNVAVTQTERISFSGQSPTGSAESYSQGTPFSTSGLTEDQLNYSNSSIVTSDRLKAIFRIGSLIKANTLIGGKLREFLRSRFGSSMSDPHELFEISSSLMDINISDIFSTTSTDQSVLGEYGGRALGNQSSSIKFSTDKNGMFFVISVALQNRYYADGTQPFLHRLTSDQYYNPAFDSLGYEIAPYSYFKCNYSENTGEEDNSFAYIPRYSDYKFFKPVVSGDFVRYGLKESILGFVGNAYKTLNSSTRLAFTMEMNKPAFYPSLYNTNHIFYESESPVEVARTLESVTLDAIYPAISDPLILHTYLKIDMHAPMIGRSDVFETAEGDNPTISVES